MKEDILIPPTGGWSAATMYIAVNPNAEAQKRKREEEVTENLAVNIELKRDVLNGFLENLTSRLLQFQFGNSDRTFIIPSFQAASYQPAVKRSTFVPNDDDDSVCRFVQHVADDPPGQLTCAGT